MEKNIFWLENDQLKEIASSFREKVEEGLKHENAEIQCIPTFISPKTSDISQMGGLPALKIGPGESARSHSADEFIRVGEVADAIDIYRKLILNLSDILENR